MNPLNFFMVTFGVSDNSLMSYATRFVSMKENDSFTWFLPPGYRIYQDLSDLFDYYRFSDQKSNRATNQNFRLWDCVKACHKHFQEKNLIHLMNKSAEVKV